MANLTRYMPTTGLSQLQREVDRLFEDFFGRTLMTDRETELQSVWTPVVDLSESDDAYLIRMDLPGLSKEDVQITFENGVLQVSGERKNVHEETKDQVHRIERWYGRFFRSFNLGQNVQADKIKATFKNGVLTIEAPKVEASKPLKIKVS
ncbi:Hsp20/alpha crystallin family protein [Rhodocaloribacter sp.]|jgi:HSP20 family protein